MKRVFLFVMTNVAVLAMLTIVFQLLGLDGILQNNGTDLNLTALLIMSAVIGFAGSFISLAISKWSAKRAMGLHVIEQPRSETEQWLVATVSRQANAAGIDTPEIAMYDSPEVNAFATGARKNSSLVAVSTGLLNSMTRDEAEAVLGHEISHVANGDMVTLTLVQGVVNTFVIFFARLVGFFVDRVVLKNEQGVGMGYYLTSFAMQIVFGFLASAVVMWFSRYREFRADIGGADLAGREKMISALEKLKRGQPQDLPGQLAAFGIGGGKSKFGRLFMSHPPLDDRIKALQSASMGIS